MRQDSGLMIVGVLFTGLGAAVVFNGLHGTGVKSPSGMRGAIHASPEEAVIMGVLLLVAGLLLVWQPWAR
ncbi:MAG TPA: hypothetical protein DCF62_07425 [Porticoccaceae bacterium]|nr:hypothetical protein [Porticoccaceae bacterium]HCO58971.1 hypothetical protein [Porticoccaceae bacterium]